jgi:hypothetical protein
MGQQATYAPYADENPWRLDTFMNCESPSQVSNG